MMGRKNDGQGQFFYHFDLEQRVPEDHLLRGVDRFLDLSGLHDHLAPFYSHTGRPSIDPELLMRMLIIGYCYGIRSERRLCEEVELNLAYRWFCRLSIEDEVPDHSTFSKNRHGRFRDSEAFRFLFEQVVERCLAEGLVSGEGFAIDASIVKADASPERSKALRKDDDDEWPRPGGSSRAVREYLTALDAGAEPMRSVSTTDPAAQFTGATGGKAFYAYSTNYLVDTQAGIIVDVQATRAHRGEEVASTKSMVERVEQRFKLKPRRLAADTAYGNADILGWLVEDKAIEPHIPVWDRSERRPDRFGRTDFAWRADADCYVCPGGKRLEPNLRKADKRHRVTKANTIIYRARAVDCRECAHKAHCCPKEPAKKIHRSIHEDARDLARSIGETAAYQRSSNQRKQVEMLFGHMKRILKLDRLRLRGLTGATDEFLLAAAAQNLRRMALWLGRSPPHTQGTAFA